MCGRSETRVGKRKTHSNKWEKNEPELIQHKKGFDVIVSAFKIKFMVRCTIYMYHIYYMLMYDVAGEGGGAGFCAL